MAISKITDNSLNITDLTIADDLTVTDDLLLASDSAVIKFGADAEITLTHSADSGLILKHAASGDDKFPILTLQTGDTDIAVNDSLGRIAFQAPDEGAGTDAILVAASIDAISEGDFSSSNNATTLDFQVGASAVARGAGDGARLRLTSAGELHLKPVSDSDGNYPIIHLQSPESNIETNDPLGEIQFSPPDEGSGTDAILVSAAIQARAESAFGSSTNATALDFKTASSEAAATKMTLSSAGSLTVPSQPSWIATGNANSNVTFASSGAYHSYTFAAETVDTTSSYNVSNGRFTAPVAGKYFVIGKLLIQGLNSATEYYCDLIISVNGSQKLRAASEEETYNRARTVQVSGLVDLSKDDYVQVEIRIENHSNQVSYDASSTSLFSGILIA